MRKDIEEVKRELSELIADNGYTFPEGKDALLRARLDGIKFMQKRDEERPQNADSLKVSYIRYFAEEFNINGNFFALVWSIYDLAFYRGYKKGQKEAYKELKELAEKCAEEDSNRLNKKNAEKP